MTFFDENETKIITKIVTGPEVDESYLSFLGLEELLASQPASLLSRLLLLCQAADRHSTSQTSLSTFEHLYKEGQAWLSGVQVLSER